MSAAKQVPIQGFAAYHPLGSERFFDDLLPDGFKLLPPKEPTIGRSLFHAARDLFDAGYSSVCLVNADSPTLPTEFLVETVRRLQEPGDRVVLGPAADGGYYLIGLKQFHRRLFEEIDWSTERVYRQTLARAGEIGVTVATLPEWYDVDDEETLAMLARELWAVPERSEPVSRRLSGAENDRFSRKAGGREWRNRTPVRPCRPPSHSLPRRRGKAR